MAVLGKGSAHGACSLLHAAALGYGACVAVDLPVTVRLLDRPSKREVVDDDDVLQHLLDAWEEMKHPLPDGLAKADLYWGVNSKIPKKQGLKSSAAMCIAAIRALCEATNVELEPHEMVNLAAQAQLNAGVSLTGSIDDAWGCMTPGWKLVDVQAPISEGILIDDQSLSAEDWAVLLVLRGEREIRPTLDDFVPHIHTFQQSLEALQQRNPLVAMTWNGRGIAAVLSDVEGRKMTNDSFMNSSRAAGISGSGPALAIVIPAQQQPTIERIKSWYSTRYKGIEILETRFLSEEGEDELE